MSFVRLRIALVAVLFLGTPFVAFAQTTDAYFEFLQARRLEADGDPKGALAALERAATADPKSAEIRAEVAALHLRRQERADAEKSAKAALALDETNVEANRVLGLLYAAQVEGSTERTPSPQTTAAMGDAILYLERAVTGAGVTADANLQFALGRLYIRSGAIDKAIQVLTRLVAQNPNAVQARIALAQAFAAGKDLKAAINVLDEILEEEPRVAPALAQYQEEAGLLKEAADTLTLALAINPNSRELKLRRISVLLEAKEYARAATAAGDAKKQHPEEPRFPRLQGRALFDSGDKTAGIAVLEAAVKQFPKDMGTLFVLADVYADAGRAADAEKSLRQVLTAEPNNASALNYLGYLLATRGEQLDEAVRLVQKALEAEPDNPAYLDSLGWAYFRKGDLDGAEKHLAAAAQKLPENSEIQDHLGDLLAKRQRWSDAIAAWNRALAGDGQGIDKAVVEKKISSAKGKVPNAR
ncbi:MAG TPA: tetratricopeptide repeat protein [Vicinamibacterales bacterium]|jgi:tetratricopeptide (TPR) repeat protein|nr:tetratricopeptide repeat protein [Vicinamibacterales bacterium]